MAKILITVTRTDTTKDWIIATKEILLKTIFTYQEKKIIKNSLADLKLLPGFVSIENVESSDTVMSYIITFDTLENAQNALSWMQDTGSSWYKRKNMIDQKRLSEGVDYQPSIQIIE